MIQFCEAQPRQRHWNGTRPPAARWVSGAGSLSVVPPELAETVAAEIVGLARSTPDEIPQAVTLDDVLGELRQVRGTDGSD